jgi:hypothetical protein
MGNISQIFRKRWASRGQLNSQKGISRKYYPHIILMLKHQGYKTKKEY